LKYSSLTFGARAWLEVVKSSLEKFFLVFFLISNCCSGSFGASTVGAYFFPFFPFFPSAAGAFSAPSAFLSSVSFFGVAALVPAVLTGIFSSSVHS